MLRPQCPGAQLFCQCFIHTIHNGPRTSRPNSTEAKFRLQGPGTSGQIGAGPAEAELLYSQSLLLLKEVSYSSSSTFLQDFDLLLLPFSARPYDAVSSVNGLPIGRGERSSAGTTLSRSAVALLPKAILALTLKELPHRAMPDPSLHPSGPTVPCPMPSLCAALLSLSCPPATAEG